MRPRTFAVALLAVVAAMTVYFAYGSGTRRASVRAPELPGLTVFSFGAVGDGRADDTAAIQEAIDSLLADNGGTPNGRDSIGGVVYFPRGTYRITKPLRLPGCVGLRGEGTGTIIRYSGKEAAAVVLYAVRPTVPYASNAVIENLSIYTDSAHGISAEAVGEKPLSVVGCRFSNLIVSTGGWAVYLPSSVAYSQNTHLDNVQVLTPGSGAVWIEGNANHVERVNTEGGARDGFKVEPAMVVVKGDGNRVSGCIIEGLPELTPAVAFYVSGAALSWQNNWGELSRAKDKTAYIFENVQDGTVDNFIHIVPHHRVKLINSCLSIGMVNLDGDGVAAQHFFDVDAASFISIDTLFTRGGEAELPGNVKVRQVYSKQARRVVKP